MNKTLAKDIRNRTEQSALSRDRKYMEANRGEHKDKEQRQTELEWNEK